MKKLLALGAAAGIATVSVLAAAPAAQAATPANAGAACVQAGIGFLKANDLLQAAAQQKIDYSKLANPTSGPIFTTLPANSYLSLGQVVKLHTSNPELFAWCKAS